MFGVRGKFGVRKDLFLLLIRPGWRVFLYLLLVLLDNVLLNRPERHSLIFLDLSKTNPYFENAFFTSANSASRMPASTALPLSLIQAEICAAALIRISDWMFAQTRSNFSFSEGAKLRQLETMK